MVTFMRSCAPVGIPCRSGVTATVPPPQLRRAATQLSVARPLLPTGSLMVRSATSDSAGDQPTREGSQSRNEQSTGQGQDTIAQVGDAIKGAAQFAHEVGITDVSGFKSDEGKDSPVMPGMGGPQGSETSDAREGVGRRFESMGERVASDRDRPRNIARQMRQNGEEGLNDASLGAGELREQAQVIVDQVRESGGEGAGSASEDVRRASPTFKGDTEAGPADQSSG